MQADIVRIIQSCWCNCHCQDIKKKQATSTEYVKVTEATQVESTVSFLTVTQVLKYCSVVHCDFLNKAATHIVSSLCPIFLINVRCSRGEKSTDWCFSKSLLSLLSTLTDPYCSPSLHPQTIWALLHYSFHISHSKTRSFPWSFLWQFY